MTDGFTPEFERALLDGSEELHSLSAVEPHSDTDLQMRARGLKHEDIALFTQSMWEAYSEDLASPDADIANTALDSIAQIALFTGMNIERRRREEEHRLLDEAWQKDHSVDN